MLATLTTEELRRLRGKRVTITFHDDETHTGVLEGATSELLYFTGEGGGVIRTEIREIALDPLVCSACGRESNRLFEGLCADDFRSNARRQAIPREPCAVCGDAGIRNPGSDVFLCTRHHAEAGNSLRIAVGSSAALADCLTEDVSSPKHDWKQVRGGARFRCVRCRTAEKYDPDLLKQIMRERTE